MPELPEVTTTVNGLNKVLKNLVITDVWSDWTKLIKFPSFKKFEKEISGRKFIKALRRGKNILINISGRKTILVHMKMTGHLMYGRWRRAKNRNERPGWEWIPEEEGSLGDPYNRFIHLIFFLSNGHQLVLCDARKFAKVALFDTDKLHMTQGLKELGPEPLSSSMSLKFFKSQLMKKPGWPIKQALLNQELIAGIGNIYSDEILWASGIHPLEKVKNISEASFKKMFASMKQILVHSISLGGDSTSDYRNIHGVRGQFQNSHKVYRQVGKPCQKKDDGIIRRTKVAGRSAHFCDKHQNLRGG